MLFELTLVPRLRTKITHWLSQYVTTIQRVPRNRWRKNTPSEPDRQSVRMIQRHSSLTNSSGPFPDFPCSKIRVSPGVSQYDRTHTQPIPRGGVPDMKWPIVFPLICGL